jgi:hypothetical protein
VKRLKTISSSMKHQHFTIRNNDRIKAVHEEISVPLLTMKQDRLRSDRLFRVQRMNRLKCAK